MKYQIGNRIKILREELGINQTEFANSLGVSNSRVSNWEKGINRPDVDLLSKICEILKVSADELLELNNDISLNSREQNIIDNYRHLSIYGKTSVEKHVDNLLSYESELKKAQTKKAALVELKPQSKELTVYDLPASAGTGQFLDSDSYQIIEFPVNEIPKNTTFGVRVSGNSMEPQFFDKDIAFVQRVHEVKSGSIGVFILNGDAYIKKMVCDQDECYLVSLNTSYDPIKVKDEDDLRIVGKVLWIS